MLKELIQELQNNHNLAHDIFKFLQMVFVKDGKWRGDAFVGREVYSQQLKACFGDRYKKRIIDLLLYHEILFSPSQKYSNFKGKEFCKTYALDKSISPVYDFLKELCGGKAFNGTKSQRKVTGYIQDKFEESESFFTYSIKDARIHSSWVTVPRDWRHNHIFENGIRLVCDADLKTAFPRMFLEWLDRGLNGVGGLGWDYIENLLQCSAQLKEDFRKYKQLFDGDFYSNFIISLKIDATRDEVKKMVNALFNSPEDKRAKLRGKYKQMSDALETEFPAIDKVFKTINAHPSLYIGGLLAREFESPIIYAIKTAMDASGMFQKSIIIHDGIEVWGDELSQAQREKLEQITDGVLKDYKYLQISFKTRDVTEIKTV